MRVVDADTYQHLRRYVSGIRFYTCQVVSASLSAMHLRTSFLEPIVMNLAQQISCVLPGTAILMNLIFPFRYASTGFRCHA